MRQLEALDLSETAAAVPLFRSEQHATLLDLFLQGRGGQKVKDVLVQSDMFGVEMTELWYQTLVPTINCIVQLLYPSRMSQILVYLLPYMTILCQEFSVTGNVY